MDLEQIMKLAGDPGIQQILRRLIKTTKLQGQFEKVLADELSAIKVPKENIDLLVETLGPGPGAATRNALRALLNRSDAFELRARAEQLRDQAHTIDQRASRLEEKAVELAPQSSYQELEGRMSTSAARHKASSTVTGNQNPPTDEPEPDPPPPPIRRRRPSFDEPEGRR